VGSLILVITDRRRLLGVHRGTLHLSWGERIDKSKLLGVVNYDKALQGLGSIPQLIVSEGITALNYPFTPKASIKQIKNLILKEIELTEHINRSLLLRNGITRTEFLWEWFKIEPLLTCSLGAMVLLLALKKVRLLMNPFDEVRGIPLWTLTFLPCLSYAVLLEIERELRYGVPAMDDARTCANTALGYLMGDLHFYDLFRLSLRSLLGFGLAQANGSKAHGGLPPYTGKLSKSSKSVQPLQCSLFPDIGV